MRKTIIQTFGLSKSFGSNHVLKDVSIEIPAGTIGLLGPNGAGKTTFIKCLLNLTPPTAGSAKILGCDTALRDRTSREKVGYSPEQDCHIPGMAGCEYVTYCGQLSGMSFRSARQRAHEILDLVGMGQERYRKIDTYSTGMKQRAKLAQALVHDPEVVILDEPTNGLDPSGREHILRLTGSLWKEMGISVVILSHLLRDVERICDRIIIIADGRILEHETLQSLRARQRHIIEILPSSDPERYESVLRNAGYNVDRLSNGRLRLETNDETITGLFKLMHDAGLPFADIHSRPDSLHGLFLQTISASLHGKDS